MKKIILLTLTALIMVGCGTKTKEQYYNDYLQEQRRIEYQNRWKGYSVIVIDECEYIVKTIDINEGLDRATQSGYLAHKGNCRFCKERRQKELKELVELLKKK